jgi:hypothetical protein
MFSHLKDVCLTYPEHFKFSLFLSISFAKASFFAFVHALFPFLFITHSSDTIKYLDSEMKKIGCRKDEQNVEEKEEIEEKED